MRTIYAAATISICFFATSCFAEIGSTPRFVPELYGVASPKQSATLRSLVSGSISNVHVHEGATVKAGDKLVSLDSRLIRAQLRVADIEAQKIGELNRVEAHLRLVTQKLERMESAFGSNSIADFELEDQRARVEQARASRTSQLETIDLAKARRTHTVEQLRLYTVVAPFDGVVTELHVKVGESVDPSATIVSVANLDVLEIDMHTPLAYFDQARDDRVVRVLAGAPINESLPAKLVHVSPIIDSASSTFRCVLEIENANRKLPAGFSVTLDPNDSARLTNMGTQRNRKSSHPPE